MELTVKEYAQLERVHEDTVRRWIAKGAIAIRRQPGGRIRIRTTADGAPLVLRLNEDEAASSGNTRR